MYLEGEENSAAHLHHVVNLLLSCSCDPEEILYQLMQNLDLDKTCSEQPTPETFIMIWCLAGKAKMSNTIGVKYLRDIAPAGTAGELASCMKSLS